jgi:hypothetical protein
MPVSLNWFENQPIDGPMKRRLKVEWVEYFLDCLVAVQRW